MRASVALLFVIALLACSGAIEKENVATTSDAGSPSPTDASSPVLDATVVDDAASDAGPRACAKNEDCNGGTCFEALCMCNGPKYVQADGRCGDAAPRACSEGGGTCRQNPATCNAGELEGDLGTRMSCGDVVPATCCFDAAKCKTTVDFVCCGASTTAYEPSCVNGWRTCAGGGPTPRLRSQGCP